MFLNYSCTPLPTTTPDNREYALCFTSLKHFLRRILNLTVVAVAVLYLLLLLLFSLLVALLLLVVVDVDV